MENQFSITIEKLQAELKSKLEQKAQLLEDKKRIANESQALETEEIENKKI